MFNRMKSMCAPTMQHCEWKKNKAKKVKKLPSDWFYRYSLDLEVPTTSKLQPSKNSNDLIIFLPLLDIKHFFSSFNTSSCTFCANFQSSSLECFNARLHRRSVTTLTVFRGRVLITPNGKRLQLEAKTQGVLHLQGRIWMLRDYESIRIIKVSKCYHGPGLKLETIDYINTEFITI